jgi:5-methyltetrahydropteroyltriglutamate--homocysteine methyltransferase
MLRVPSRSGPAPHRFIAEEEASLSATARHPARSEHVGSVLRSPELLREIDAVYEDRHTALLDEERARDLGALHAAEDACVEAVVRRQEAIGLDVISDGEVRRRMYTSSFYDAVEGLAQSPMTLEFRDAAGDVAEFAGPPVIVQRLRKVANPAAEEARRMTALTSRPFKVTFPAVSWLAATGAFSPAVGNGAYESLDDLVGHVAELQIEIARETVDAGAQYLQFDTGVYSFFIDEHFKHGLTDHGVNPERALELGMRADTRVLEALPDDITTGFHFCRGNFRSRWLLDGSIEPVAEAMFSVPFDRFLIEWEDEERQGDFSPLRHVPRGGPIVTLGIISSKRSRLEDEDDMVRLIESAARYVPIEQLAVSPQCGFASTSEGNEISADDQWRKLELVERVAERVWGS